MAGAVSVSDDDSGGTMSDINVTPLVDVVLVLLIVFMITVPTIIGSTPVRVDLPTTSAALNTVAEKLPLNVFMKREAGRQDSAILERFKKHRRRISQTAARRPSEQRSGSIDLGR